jgi:hypothetical protein
MIETVVVRPENRENDSMVMTVVNIHKETCVDIISTALHDGAVATVAVHFCI